MCVDVFVDFETFYDRDFTLKKLTTAEYIRRPEFEVIGVGITVGDDAPVWYSGTYAEIRTFLSEFTDWSNARVVYLYAYMHVCVCVPACVCVKNLFLYNARELFCHSAQISFVNLHILHFCL